MKKYLLLLIIWIGSNLEGRCQTSNDTLCFPVPVIKKVLIAASQKKVADSLLIIAEKQVKELQITIDILGDKSTEQKAMCDNQLEILHKEIDLYKDQINGYEKLLKRERRKRFFTAVGGVLTTSAALFLFISK